MNTLKLWTIISIIFALAAWRLYAALTALDPQISTAINEAAPYLTLWIEIDLVLLVAGFLILAGYAILNELEYERKINTSYHDFKKHAEEELTSTIKRSVKSEYQDFEKALVTRQFDLEEAEQALREKQEALALCERAVAARTQANKELYEELAPLHRCYEDGKSSLNSYLEVLKDDCAQTQKALTKLAAWVKLAVTDPEKFIADVKVNKVNNGWIDRLIREQEKINIRTEGTKVEVEQVQESVRTAEIRRKKGVPL